jgi:uncharacterized protein YcaQ
VGLFVMPILHGDRLIGRVDPWLDRERACLRVNAVFAESGAPGPPGRRWHGRSASWRLARRERGRLRGHGKLPRCGAAR